MQESRILLWGQYQVQIVRMQFQEYKRGVLLFFESIFDDDGNDDFTMQYQFLHEKYFQVIMGTIKCKS
jgi:hypothetical protein